MMEQETKPEFLQVWKHKQHGREYCITDLNEKDVQLETVNFADRVPMNFFLSTFSFAGKSLKSTKDLHKLN